MKISNIFLKPLGNLSLTNVIDNKKFRLTPTDIPRIVAHINKNLDNSSDQDREFPKIYRKITCVDIRIVIIKKLVPAKKTTILLI